MLESWGQREVSYKSFASAFIDRRLQAEISIGALAKIFVQFCLLRIKKKEIRAARRYQDDCDRQSATTTAVQFSGRETTLAGRHFRSGSVVRLYGDNLP